MDSKRALSVAVEAAMAAGNLMYRNWRTQKRVNSEAMHDIKLELDERCQEKICKILRSVFPKVAVLGEEGTVGDPLADERWVIDPIDGTVNFAYQIPHACVSIALQQRQGNEYVNCVGVVRDPFCDELWTAVRGKAARLNGKKIRVSQRARLSEAVVSVGFAKYDENLKKMLPQLEKLAPRVRKIRIMGSAALDLVYVACGRMDAYLESGVRLWDIAAGAVILESAGGEFWHRALPGEHTYHIVANNGLLRPELERLNQGESK